MMPTCDYVACDEVATFLGPNEVPAACNEHLAKLKERIAKHEERTKPTPPIEDSIKAQLALYTAAANSFYVDCGTRHDKDLPSYKRFMCERDALLALAESETSKAVLNELFDLGTPVYGELGMSDFILRVTGEDIRDRIAELQSLKQKELP